MHHDHTTQHSASAKATGSREKLRGAMIMLGFIGAFFLMREHWSHIAGYWSYLLLLACPLMHFFHGHGGHGSQKGNSGQE